MANPTSLWWPDDPVDDYEGKVFDRDGRAAWVLRRVHRASGWCVEVRADDPNGDLVSRSWVVAARPARSRVEEIRYAIARTTIDELALGPVEPPPPRDIVAAHGLHGRQPELVGVADDPTSETSVCATFWLPPGRAAVVWNCGRPQSIEVRAGEVVHAGGHGFPFPGLPRPVRSSIGRWWFCPLRSLRFEDGALPASTDLRGR